MGAGVMGVSSRWIDGFQQCGTHRFDDVPDISGGRREAGRITVPTATQASWRRC